MFFEHWCECQGIDLKKVSRAEGKELWKQFKEEMTPVVKECADWLSEMLLQSKDTK